MYQLLLVMTLVLSIGGALVISISRGSAGKAYTSLSTTGSIETMIEDDTLKKTLQLAEEHSYDESLVSATVKSLLGVETKTHASPMLTRTITGTYACESSSSTQNPPCSTSYVFVFKPNSAAVLRIENERGEVVTTEIGTWALNKEEQIVVTLFTDGKRRFDQDRTFTLLRGKKAQLITIEYPYDIYPDIMTGIFKFIKK